LDRGLVRPGPPVDQLGREPDTAGQDEISP
jgi:hypothetical protein